MSTLHTTLAQDSFRLYFGVIDYVIEHVKKDLQKKGKDEEEATEIVNKLQAKWKENLHKSRCIDNKNMMGFNMVDSSNNTTNNEITAMFEQHNNNNTNHATSFTQLTPQMMHAHDEGPQRKRQKLINHNNNIPPALNAPNIIQANYPLNNPHIQGLGVPQIDQVHNPFTHPRSQSKPYGGNDSIVQYDGPSPMRPTTVGFDDDDDDDEDEDVKASLSANQNEKKEEKESAKEENNVNNIEIQQQQQQKQQPHIVNGRDLNAPLCSDDDDTDDAQDLNPSDKIICQFTKVVRKKNEWTVELRHGLMHINGKDYAFHTASGGSFTWK